MSKNSCQRCGHSEHGANQHPCAMCGNPQGLACIPASTGIGARHAYEGAFKLERQRHGVPKALLMGEGDPGSSVEWGTPVKEFDKWDARYTFTLDPASALGYHTSDVILSRPGGEIFTLDGGYWHESGGVGGPSGINDGLAVEWSGRVWMNHPFGRKDWQWVKKAHDSVRFGSADLVCALVPVKPQMKWWHKYVMSSAEIIRGPDKPYRADPKDASAGVLARFMVDEAHRERGEYGADIVSNHRGRLRFVGAPSSAPFPTAIVVWCK